MPQVRIPLRKPACEAIITTSARVLSVATLVRGVQNGEAYLALIVADVNDGIWRHRLTTSSADRLLNAHLYHVALSADEQVTAVIAHGDETECLAIDRSDRCFRPETHEMAWIHDSLNGCPATSVTLDTKEVVISLKNGTHLAWDVRNGTVGMTSNVKPVPVVSVTRLPGNLLSWSPPPEYAAAQADAAAATAADTCDQLGVNVDGVAEFLKAWLKPSEPSKPLRFVARANTVSVHQRLDFDTALALLAPLSDDGGFGAAYHTPPSKRSPGDDTVPTSRASRRGSRRGSRHGSRRSTHVGKAPRKPRRRTPVSSHNTRPMDNPVKRQLFDALSKRNSNPSFASFSSSF